MGGFWTSLTLRASEQRRVADAVTRLGRVAFVAPAERGWVTVFDSASDRQDEAEVVACGQGLTRELETSGLAVLVHDGDALAYWLFDRGRLIDHYESWPGYPCADPQRPAGGDPARLCRVLRVACHDGDVASVLHELGDHADALFLHEALAKSLEMPSWSVGLGYEHLARGEHPDGRDPLSRASLLHVGKDGVEEPQRPEAPEPGAAPAAAAGKARAQLLPFVKPGSGTEEELAELRATMMDRVAEKLLDEGGLAGFLLFLEERLAGLAEGTGPAALRALQAQLPLLEALRRRCRDSRTCEPVEDLIRRIRAAGT